MKKFRLEKDSIGFVEVPKNALFGAQTARAIANFPISGRTADPALIRAFLRIKKGAAIANRMTGALDARRSRLIVKAADRTLKAPVSRWPEFFPVDIYQAGAGTSQNMNVNEVLANTANREAGGRLGVYDPIHPNDHVNASQSTNDVFPTALRLALLEVSRELHLQISRLARQLEIHSRAWWKIPKAARTHLQDAVPMRLGQEFSGYAETLRRCEASLLNARAGLRELGISGSAAGTGLNVPRGYGPRIVRELSRLSGERLNLSKNLFFSMQSQGVILSYSSSLRLLAVEMTRLCNDLRLLASGPLTGLGELELPAVQPGSSIMPGKVNPSILEMCNQSFFAVLGHDRSVELACQAGQLELNVMMPLMACAMLDATRIASASLCTLREKTIQGLKPNLPMLRRHFESTPQIATALSPRLGYDQTASLVKEALKTGVTVVELIRQKGLLSPAELRKLLSLDRLAP